MRRSTRSFTLLFLLVCSAAMADAPMTQQAVDYNQQVAPLLRKYCSACHNADDREGGLALDSYAALLKGGEHGAVVTAEHSDVSRLVRVLTGEDKPLMPPEGSDGPKQDEIALLARWIDEGAKGPQGAQPDPTILITPKFEPTAPVKEGVTAVAVSPQADVFALARYGTVELRSLKDDKLVRELAGHRGPVNAVAFSEDGKRLVAAAGEPGLFGEARLWNVKSGKLVKLFVGHRDALYAARLDPDGKLLATGGYDQLVKLWNVASGKELRTLSGHNGAVYDLAFHPQGKILASASGDRTVKLWSVADGKRLDTFGQSLMELYALTFSPDGRRLAAGGVDNRIRVWEISPTGEEGTNPLVYSRFAHEAPILRLVWSRDGRTLVSTGEDRMIKVWDAGAMRLRQTLKQQPDWASGVAFAPNERSVIVGRLDGGTANLTIALKEVGAEEVEPLSDVPIAMHYAGQPPLDKLPRVAESEPNSEFAAANQLSLPGVATGRIFGEGESTGDGDVDLYRVSAKAGEQWILETKAERMKSPLDTKIEVLHADGRPVERLLLRAVRDAEVTFRGINSDTLDCRTTNWEEMELNQLLYLSGEVVKLYRMPRGPDSGFQFYPGVGKRQTYFDTSARSHALFEPCYIVVPYPPGTELPDNGLPVFPVYFENDDESRQMLGSDSRLTFTAPSDGEYLVRVSDVRGAQGEDFRYELTVRRPQPDFKVKLTGQNPQVDAGSGKSFSVSVERIDNFNGPIRIDVEGLPPGFQASAPLVIEEGHLEAKGVISALPDAPAPTEENWAKTKVTATAMVAGQEVTHEIGTLGMVKLAEKPKLVVHLEAIDDSQNDQVDDATGFRRPPVVKIAPGTTVTCRLRVERNGFDDRIKFEVENLPHGVIVDNIGLSGVLIPEGETQRTIFLTAASWTPPTRREFFAVGQAAGNQSSLPAVLVVGE
ncbi:MAG: c-type cytochrome domain-containing protein [Pirellulaceae bacterium]